jgi:predicted nucleotidyltransferase
VTTLLSPSAAAVLLVVDEADEATLTQLGHITERSTSTVQRAIASLTAARVLARTAPRGPVHFAPGAPVQALREVAEWQLGREAATRLRARARRELCAGRVRAPSTITNPQIRAAWPAAIAAIVATAHPERILLFGSQARGNALPDSDVDFLVVVDPPVDKREVGMRVRRALAGMPFAKDVLVAATSELDTPMPGTALVHAVRSGVVVYER